MRVIGNAKACCKTNDPSKDCCCCCPCRNTDILLLCDTTGSMGGTITGVQDAFSVILDKLISDDVPETERCRIAVADFKDNYDGGDYALPGKGYSLKTPFTINKTTVQSAIDGLTAEGGFDTPEEWSASLVGAADYWTSELGGSTQVPQPAPPGRYRIIILATDAAAHYYPDCCDGEDGPGGCARNNCYPTEDQVTNALAYNCIYLHQLATGITSAAEIRKAICKALRRRLNCDIEAEVFVQNKKLYFNKYAKEQNQIQRKIAYREYALDAQSTLRRKQWLDKSDILRDLAEQVQNKKITAEEYLEAVKNHKPLNTPQRLIIPATKKKPCQACKKKIFD